MSYILDALRKSDQQRRRGATPTLQSAPSLSESSREPRRVWTYAGLAVVLAGVAFAIGWLRPWQTEPPAKQAGPVASQPADAKDGEPIPTRSVVAAREEPPPPPQPPVAPDVRPAIPAPQAEEAGPTARADAPRVATTKRTRPKERVAERSADAPKLAPEKEEKAVPLAELPAAIRQELPPMTITVHAYSRTPKDRLVGVNDKLLHEGESFNSDLVLERITPDGMIFSYKGTRFQRGVQ